MKVLCILVLCVAWLGTLDVYRPSRFRCEFLYIGRITSLVVLSGVVSVRLSYVAVATCALASFWLSQSDPSLNAQGGVCGSGGNRTLAHPTVTFLLLLRIVVEHFNLRYPFTGFHCQVCGSGWNRTTAQAKSYDAGCSSLPVFHSLPMSLLLVFWK